MSGPSPPKPGARHKAKPKGKSKGKAKARIRAPGEVRQLLVWGSISPQLFANSYRTLCPCQIGSSPLRLAFTPRRTHTEEDKQNFHDQLNAYLNTCSEVNPILIVGDFNARLHGRKHAETPYILAPIFLVKVSPMSPIRLHRGRNTGKNITVPFCRNSALRRDLLLPIHYSIIKSAEQSHTQNWELPSAAIWITLGQQITSRS